MAVGDLDERRVVEHLALRQGRVRGQEDVLLQTVREQLVLGVIRMVLDLVGQDRRFREVDRPAGLVNVEVAHPDVLDPAVALELVHGLERLLERDLVAGRMNQQKVDVVRIKPMQALLEGLPQVVIGQVLRQDLGRQENVFAVE